MLGFSVIYYFLSRIVVCNALLKADLYFLLPAPQVKKPWLIHSVLFSFCIWNDNWVIASKRCIPKVKDDLPCSELNSYWTHFLCDPAQNAVQRSLESISLLSFAYINLIMWKVTAFVSLLSLNRVTNKEKVSIYICTNYHHPNTT